MVTGLTEQDIVTYVIDRSMFPLKDGWGIEPIPLTEERLLELGFKQCGYEGLFWEHEELEGLQFAGINWADYEFPEYQFLNYQVGKVIYQIHYVHQIQNLYFTLKGKELKQLEQ
jgi:hypothetical protein